MAVRTLKQMKAIENVLKNGGNVTKAMRDAGYNENTVQNPSNLTKSDTWIEIMGKHWDDEKLAQIGDEGLKSYRHFDKETKVPDFGVRHRYWETILGMKGKLEKTTINIQNIIPVQIVNASEQTPPDEENNPA